MGGYQRIAARLATGGTVLLDGATGTELRQRGARMDHAAWCALATLSHPSVLRGIHLDYLRLGVDVITTNTFSAARHVMELAGRAADTRLVHQAAARIAREARDVVGRPAAVAGSISTVRPDAAAVAAADRAQVRGWFAEVADTLAEAGVDFLLLEMICDLDWGLPAIEAALATGLPVWVGTSVRRGADGRLMGYYESDGPFDELVAAVAGLGVAGIGVMHSEVHDTGPALAVLRRHWGGPVIAYPEAGWSRPPDWIAHELDPQAFAQAALEWRAQGAQVLGGCCGLGPPHIEALAQGLRRAGALPRRG